MIYQREGCTQAASTVLLHRVLCARLLQQCVKDPCSLRYPKTLFNAQYHSNIFRMPMALGTSVGSSAAAEATRGIL